MSSIIDVNSILGLEDRRIVGRGTHGELLAAEGAYRAFYNAQFSAPVADEV